MKTIKKFYPYICIFIFTYGLLYSFYLATSFGLADKTIYLQSRRYIPCALAVTVSCYFWCRFNFPLYKLYPHALVALFWIFTYPLCYWFTFHLNTNFIDNHYDQAFGAYIFTVTVCLRLLWFHFYDNPHRSNVGGITSAILQVLLLLVPFIEIIYFRTYDRPVSEAACIAFLQTNPAEAQEFILQIFSVNSIIGTVIFLLFLLIFFIKSNKLPCFVAEPISSSDSSAVCNPVPATSLRKMLLYLVVLLVVTGIYCVRIFPKTGVLERLVFAKQYYEESAKFTVFHKENFPLLDVTPPAKKFREPGTIIIVIGESASRDFLSAYGYKKYDTTPWLLHQVANNPDFILFRHAYTSWGQTVPSLERALTEKNQYNNKEFNRSFTVLDLAKKAGFTTYWFSNQGIVSDADTPITLVAKTADYSAWIEDTLANTSQRKYDKDLLQYVKQVDAQKNNFIVLHIMGSHDNYYNRYPPEFTKWGNPKEYIPEIGYVNSLAYTDELLKELHAYAVKHLNLQVMLYFSDHGAVPGKLRDADISSFTALHIPMFMYLSKEFQSLYPETFSTLKNHERAYFTNDLIYETVAGLLHIKSNHYNPENSLALPFYKWTRETLTTNLGKHKLSEDITEKQF